MNRQLSRVLKVRSGEWSLVLLLQLQLFLIIAVLLIAKPAGNAFFLSRFGSGALPYMYILTAMVAGAVSLSFSTALRYHSILRVNVWSTGICLVSLLLFALGVPINGARDIVAIGLYLWVALYGVVAASQFWLVANLIFDIRQAKRLFGFIGAGGIAGGIVGGYVANIIANAYDFQTLLFVAVALIVPGIIITLHVWKNYIEGKIPKLARRRRRAELQTSPLGLIKESRHLSLLCGIVGLSVIVAKLVDYQFSAMALKRFANEEHLTAFFGFWFSTFNAIGLIIQLLFTQRLIKYLGISGALLFLPAGLIVGSLTMFVLPGLAAATFTRGIDGSFKQSLHRVGLEMLFLPVGQEVKERIKTYIDVFIDSVAGGIGGFLLLLLVDGLHFPVPWISGLILVLAAVWLLLVILIREEYLQAFRLQLAALRKPRQKRKSLQSKHKEVIKSFLRVLQDHSNQKEQQLLYVLEKSPQSGRLGFQKPVTDLLQHSSPRVKTRAIQYLAQCHHLGVVDKITVLLDDPDPQVRVAALAYLIGHFPQRHRQLIDERLTHPDPNIAGPVLLTLVGKIRNNDYISMKWDLPGLFSDKVKQLSTITNPTTYATWQQYLLEICGVAAFPQARAYLKEQLESESELVRQWAITAAGNSLNERWLPRLIDFLSEAPDRPYAKKALVQYGLGLIDILPDYFRRDEIDIEDVRRLPAVMEQIGQQATVNLLLAMLAKFYPSDLEFRLEAIRSLCKLRRNFPDLNMPAAQIYRQILQEAKTCQLTMESISNQKQLHGHPDVDNLSAREGLINLLQLRHRSNVERLFLSLGLRYHTEDIKHITLGLQQGDRVQQGSAIEFLDNLLDNSLKQFVIPIAEYELQGKDQKVMSENTTELYDEQYRQFRRILRGRDRRLKLAALHLMSYLPEQRYVKLLEIYAKVNHIQLRDVASRGLERAKERVE